MIAVEKFKSKSKTHDINEQVFTGGGHHLTVKAEAQRPHLPAEIKQREMRLGDMRRSTDTLHDSCGGIVMNE